VTDASADRTPTDRFLDALEVRRNATVGLVVGALVAIVVYAFFVAVPVFVTVLPDPRQSALAYVPLAVVLGFGLALLVALGLTVRTAGRLSRETESGP
jgi:TRAP-type C4-dicarboxylate transport system permease small subunit